MPRIKRKKPPKHAMVCDTNILWHEDKGQHVVSAEFTEFWDSSSDRYEIELSVPSVVRGELLFQHTKSAWNSLNKANGAFERMSAIGANKYKHRVTRSRLRRDVEKKIDGWLSKVSAQIVEVPINDVDWESLIDNAIWRAPPFIEDKDSEKGFRDALILETVSSMVENSSSSEIAFISKDGLLRETAEKRFKDHNNVGCYQSVEDFSSTLRLLEEELTNEFVRSIRVRAQLKFFKPRDSSSLYYREELISTIKEQFSEEFAQPPSNALAGLVFSGAPRATQRWVPFEQEGRWIWRPSFQRLDGDKKFVWISRVTLLQLFRSEGSSVGTLLAGGIQDNQINLRKLEFDVEWHSIVGTDGRFRSLTLENISLASKSFEPPTENEIEEYSLPVGATDDT